MTTKTAHMPPMAYLDGSTLWEALFDFGEAGAVAAYNGASSSTPRTAPKEGAGMLDILNSAMQDIQNIQKQGQRREDALEGLKDDFLELIRIGHLIAFGFKIPRNIEDQPVKIPADLLLCGEIDWNESELKSQNLEFSSVRIFKNTGAVIDVTPQNAPNEKKQIENKSAKKKFSDLDPNLHIPEKQAAEFLGVSPRTLQGYRLKGGGPKYRKIGNKAIRYKIQDLIEWSDKNKRENTSE